MAARKRLLLLFLGLAGCDATAPDSAVVFVFHHREAPGAAGQFVAATDDPHVILAARAQLLLPIEQRRGFINGPVDRGNGGHNEPWSWHFLPSEWHLATIAAEGCDGTPQMVEDDVDYWVDDLGHFCPWSSYVVGER